MAIDIEHLKHFQLEQLEQKNIQTSARIPVHSRTVEWALIEIVILLTGIGDSLKPDISNNVGSVKPFLSALLRALRRVVFLVLC